MMGVELLLGCLWPIMISALKLHREMQRTIPEVDLLLESKERKSYVLRRWWGCGDMLHTVKRLESTANVSKCGPGT